VGVDVRRVGRSGVLDRLDVQAVVMAADMSVAMMLWMRLRSGTWAGAGLMSASMLAPFVLLVPFGRACSPVMRCSWRDTS
jgi:hypothetical protein